MSNFVDVDLGASGTRFTSNCGKIGLPSNRMAFVDLNKTIDIEPYDATLENSLEVIIEKQGELIVDGQSILPAKVLVGSMAERYTSLIEKPSILRPKHSQRVNYISAILACAMARVQHDVGEDIELYIAIPPVEVKSSKEVFINSLVGKYTVTFPKYQNGVTVNLNITEVKCFAEAYMAVVSYFFNMAGVVREEAKQFMTGTVLSLDIGASTSDLAIIRDGRYLERTGRTIKTGGNVANAVLENLITEKYDCEMPSDVVERAMAEGRLPMGNTFVDVGDLVTEAKEFLAGQIVTQLQNYFKTVEIPVQTIRGIIVSGGGSMQGQYVNESTGEVVKTSEPISHFVTKNMQSVCSGVEAVPYGEDARLANIRGLYIRSRVDEVQKQRAPQPAPQPVVQAARQVTPQPAVQNPATNTVAG